MGEEGVTLRWTIWTNTPFRGEYAACCKNLVNLQVYGFCQGRWSPGGLKKKSLVPPSPTSPYIKQKDFIRRGSSQPSPFKSLAAPPPSPSPPLGKLFRLPYSLARFRLYLVQIKCTLFVYLCSYLSSAAVRHVSRIPYLILH